MSEEDFAALKDQVEGLKLALTKKEAEAQQTAANIALMELELKKLLKSGFYYRPGDKRHKTQKSKFEIFCPEIAHGMPIHLV